MNGIYLLANDVVLDWVITIVESIRAHHCALPICIIAFDERTQRLETLATKYHFEIWNDQDVSKLDAVGSQFYPVRPIDAHMFRRLASFWGPFEHFIFADVDIVALMNWDELLNAYMTSGSRFWYFGRSETDVYCAGEFLDEFRRQGGGVQFNGGFFVSSRHVITYERILELVPRALALRSHLKSSGEQPFFNFYLDSEQIPVESASAYLPDLYDWNWAPSSFLGRTDFYEIAEREGNFLGKRFPMIHWAGYDPSSHMPQRELFLKYRLRNAPLRDRLYFMWVWRVRPIFGNMLRALKTLRAQPQ